jgi:hypothetical protein
MRKEPTKTELVEALIDLLFIAENDSNLKDDSTYKEYKRAVLSDVEKLDVYGLYDRLKNIELQEPAYKSHYLH